MEQGWPLAVFALFLCQVFVYALVKIDENLDLNDWQVMLLIVLFSSLTMFLTGVFGVALGIIK